MGCSRDSGMGGVKIDIKVSGFKLVKSRLVTSPEGHKFLGLEANSI